MTSSPFGLHRVCVPEQGEPGGGATVLPQAAWRLDPDPRIRPDEVRVRVERLNLDAASFRQLRESTGGGADDMRAAVLEVITSRGKMHNPVTGSGGMLTGVVAEAGPQSPLGLRAGMRIATLVSLSLTRWPSPTASRPGTASRSRSRAQGTRSCSPGRSRSRCRTICPGRWRWPSSTFAAPPR